MVVGIQFPSIDVLLQLLGIGLSNGAVIALNAIGVTLVYGAIRTINFAHGDLFALTTVVVTTIITSLGLQRGLPTATLAGGLLLALAGAIAFGVLLNVAVERVAFRPFRSSGRLAPLIASIGLSFILFQVALILRAGLEVGWGVPEHHSDVDNLNNVPHASIPDLVPNINLIRAFQLPLHISYTLKDLLVLLLAAGLAISVTWFIQQTRIGRALRACAQDPEAARLCGVNHDATIRIAFAIGGGLAGAAACIFALYYDRPFGQHGVQSGLIAFAAAVLGGIGRPRGAFLSGLLLGILAAMSDYFLAPQWTPVLTLVILILLLVLRPTGLSSEERGEDIDSTAAESLVRRGRPTQRIQRFSILLLVLALIYPLIDIMLGFHVQPIVNGILIFAILALGLNIVLGFAGMLDLGFAACFGIGGYTTAILTTAGGRLTSIVPQPVDFLVVLGLSAAIAAFFGILNGTLTIRMRGDYLAIATLAFGQLVPQVFLNLDQWTGGRQGLSALPAPRLLIFIFQTPTERYYLVLALLLMLIVISRRVVSSRLGRAWAAMSEDETAARSCGVNPIGSKPLAFALGAAVAGIAGALYASIFSYVNADQADFSISAMVLAMVVIGGTGSVQGAMIGTLLIAGYNQIVIPSLGEWLDRLGQASGGWLAVASNVRELNFLAFGLALYLTVLFRARQRSTPRWWRHLSEHREEIPTNRRDAGGAHP